jgi:hypothetical protein
MSLLFGKGVQGIHADFQAPGLIKSGVIPTGV